LFQFDFLVRASTIYFISVPTDTTLIMQTLDADKDIKEWLGQTGGSAHLHRTIGVHKSQVVQNIVKEESRRVYALWLHYACCGKQETAPGGVAYVNTQRRTLASPLRRNMTQPAGNGDPSSGLQQ